MATLATLLMRESELLHRIDEARAAGAEYEAREAYILLYHYRLLIRYYGATPSEAFNDPGAQAS